MPCLIFFVKEFQAVPKHGRYQRKSRPRYELDNKKKSYNTSLMITTNWEPKAPEIAMVSTNVCLNQNNGNGVRNLSRPVSRGGQRVGYRKQFGYFE